MKVDVEGYEYEVLEGNDWKRFRPEVICIESNHIQEKDWRPLLNKAQYSLIYNDGLNDYYVARESGKRAKHFSYPEAMILDKPIISPGVATLLQEYEHLAHLYNKDKALIDQIARLEVRVAEQNVLINNLQIELSSLRGIKRQLRELYKTVDKKIIDTIERRGRIRKTRSKRRIYSTHKVVINDAETNVLLFEARKHDTFAFYRYQNFGISKKLQYRMLDKKNRNSRDAMKATVKGGYKLTNKLIKKGG